MVTLIFDCNALYAKSYFAAQDTVTREPDPLKTITYTLNTIFSLLDPDEFHGRLQGVHIDRVLFAWDGAHNKAKKREDKPQVYHDTRVLVRDILGAVFGGATYEHKNYEADDIIATAACELTDDVVYVVSSDKDLMQLQDKHIRFYCLQTKAVLSQAFICNKFNVKHPSHISIALAIQGDSTDAITGIRGWGEKKVKKLFETVPKDAGLEEALEIIDAQIPEDKKDQFYEAFKRTLLNVEVPGVPVPGPVELLGLDEMLALGVAFDQQKYSRVVREYDDITYD